MKKYCFGRNDYRKNLNEAIKTQNIWKISLKFFIFVVSLWTWCVRLQNLASREQCTFKCCTTYSQTQLVKGKVWYVLFNEIRYYAIRCFLTAVKPFNRRDWFKETQLYCLRNFYQQPTNNILPTNPIFSLNFMCIFRPYNTKSWFKVAQLHCLRNFCRQPTSSTLPTNPIFALNFIVFFGFTIENPDSK